uniref:Fucosyltransferase n=1 Tax=Rhabditophanes sp. KR3021 TaxID=114890 RepID=A0AC35TGB9_9BILA
MPIISSPYQRKIWFSAESSNTVVNNFSPKSYFDYTLTYHSKSDAIFSYARELYNKTIFLQTDGDVILKSKGILRIAGFISNCKTQSRREDFIEKLAKYTQVDIYGKCSKNLNRISFCEKWDNICVREVIEEYPFHLVLENSMCDEYITEKYYDRFYYNSIPIVSRRKFYSKIVPNESFIALDDYNTGKEMVNHLQYLIDNPLRYLNYFEYRKSEYIPMLDQVKLKSQRGVYGLCDLLKKNKYKRSKKKIENVVEEFGRMSECDSADAISKMLNNW